MLSALNYFSLPTKLTDFLENVCAVSDFFFWGGGEIPPIETEIQPRKYNSLHVKCLSDQKHRNATFIVKNIRGMPGMYTYFQKQHSHGSRDTAQKFR